MRYDLLCCFPMVNTTKGHNAMQIHFLNPPTLCPTFGWTHVVTAMGGKSIYVSGQVSVNERGEIVGKGDLRAQTIQTFGISSTRSPPPGRRFATSSNRICTSSA